MIISYFMFPDSEEKPLKNLLHENVFYAEIKFSKKSKKHFPEKSILTTISKPFSKYYST